MTRIVGGRWRGRRLATPAGGTTRPTSEKVRAALASSLTATGGLVGAAVLDLYAGSGALGLELVSRGAASAVFVERDRAALLALRANVAALGRSAPGSTTPGSRDPGTRGRGPDELDAPLLTVIPGDVAACVSRLGAGGAGGAPGGVPAGVGPTVRPFDVVLADPPYDQADAELFGVLLALHRAGLLAVQADLVTERGVKSGEPAWPDPLEGVRARRYGDTLLCYGRAP